MLGRAEAYERIASSLIASAAALRALGWTPRVAKQDGLAALERTAGQTLGNVVLVCHLQNARICSIRAGGNFGGQIGTPRHLPPDQHLGSIMRASGTRSSRNINGANTY